MKPIILMLGFILLLPLPAAAQTPAPPSNTTIVQPDNVGPSASSASTTSVTGNTETTVTNIKREDGSMTTIIVQQPQSTYQPMGQGGYQPMGRR
jgi:hypothetical protein